MNQAEASATYGYILRDRLLNRRMLDKLFLVLGTIFTSYFLFSWVLLPSWIHSEFVTTAPAYLLKPGESLFSNSLEYIFNLKLSEGGFYRPRFLSFLIQFFDTNLAFRLYKSVPQIGIKLPSYAFSILATVASFVWFWRTLFPRSGYGIALIGGASLLYYDIYLNTSFMVLRGGKFLVSAAGLFCITIFIRSFQRDFLLCHLCSCFCTSVILFLLATLDEQITAVVFFIAILAMIIGWLEKRWSHSVVIFTSSAVLFCGYYIFLGRWIFACFTPGGIELAGHPHQFQDILTVDMTVVASAVEMLLANVKLLGVSGYIIPGVLVFSFTTIVAQGEKGYGKLLISLAFSLFPVILTSLMVSSHPSIYAYKFLWNITYLIFPVHMLIVAAAYSAHLADFKNDYFMTALAVTFICICTFGAINLGHANQVACTNTSVSLAGFACGENPIACFR